MENEIMSPAAPENAELSVQPSASQNGIVADFRQVFKFAEIICKAGNIPEAYRNKPADTAIAIDMADRMGVPLMMVMQNMYVVKGKPSWSGQACKTLVEGSRKFKNVRTVYSGKEDSEEWGCRVVALWADSGEEVLGPKVTMTMAKDEGWTSNSKWKNMPELMLAYRAAAFFARVHCPEALMGVQTAEEIEDVTAKRKVEDPL